MKVICLAYILLTISLPSLAKDLSAYYGQGLLTPNISKETLHKIMLANGQKSVTYGEVRQFLFKEIYLEKDHRGYFIRDVYCERNLYEHNLGGKVGPKHVPDHTIMNIEHTWPQSRFSNQFPKDIQKTDMHHLFPSNSPTNSLRGNLMFAEVNPNNEVHNCEASNYGSAQLKEDGKDYFEPAPEHRGNVARALFYFSVRYKTEITPTEEYYLRKWHDEDPVDEKEKARHEKIVEIEKIRNPFIDYPQLVEKLDNF